MLIQYMVTLAVSDGFSSEELLSEVRKTTSYFSVSDEEWRWCLDFIVRGGQSLAAYDDYHKVVVEEGRYKVVSRKVAMRHKFNIGTIVSSMMVKVKLQKGSFLGHVEEYFISKLMPGDSFWFAGRCLELVRFELLVEIADNFDAVSVAMSMVLTGDLVARAKKLGLEIYAFTARLETAEGNVEKWFERLVSTGVDGIFADQPDLLIKTVADLT